MPAKKSLKAKSVKKSAVSRVEPAVQSAPKQTYVSSGHRNFLAALVLFSGFSLYAITSFMTSNNAQIEKMYTSVISSAEIRSEVAVNSDIPKENPFSDLPSMHPNYDAIIDLYYRGVVTGYDNGTFKPDNKVNRAEFAKILAESVDVDYTAIEAANLSNCFTDVKDMPDHWFAPSVCAAKFNGWVNGYASGGYGPVKNITKAEGLKIVLNAFGFEVPANGDVAVMPYSDVKAEDWYLGVAQAAKDNKLASKSDVFMPTWQLTRGDVLQIIFNAMEAKGSLE